MTPTEDTSNAKKIPKSSNKDELKLRPSETMTVLIVDDEAESVLPLKRILQDQGCTVYFLNDGSDAAEFLSGNEKIKLVFLDWNMPEIEGGEALERAEKTIAADEDLKEAWLHRNIPVVTYTGAEKATMHFPKTSHFAFIDHWPKTMRLSELRLQVQSVMTYIQNRGH